MTIQAYYQGGETARLEFRKLEKKDVLAWTPFFIANKMLPFVGLNEVIVPEEHAKFWIDKQLERYVETSFGQLAVLEKESGKLIGVSGIIPRDIEGVLEYEITYSFLPAYWGMGFASEATQFFLKIAQNIPGIESVISIIAIENFMSQQVARKMGMEKGKRMTFMGMEVFKFYKELNKK
jgi:[ribosomal protein S5]-alanine N-acetyltransferase